MTYRLPRGVNVSNPESKAVAVLLLREEATASTRDEDPRHAQDPGLCPHVSAFPVFHLPNAWIAGHPFGGAEKGNLSRRRPHLASSVDTNPPNRSRFPEDDRAAWTFL